MRIKTKVYKVPITAIVLAASACSWAASEQIVSASNSFTVVEAPADKFTGEASFTRFPVMPSAGDVAPTVVNFSAGARSNWHIHPNGQYLIVIEGEGQTQQWGNPVQTIRAGDTVWCPPGVKHWHGASEHSAMRHIAISPVAGEGESVTWLEKVELKNTEKDIEKSKYKALNDRQAAIVPIAALTASGQLDKLRLALHRALDQGLTVYEAREVMIQLYAYAGFPRSLNGLNTLIAVIDERAEQGLETTTGKDASPLPADYDANSVGNKVRNEITGRDMTNNPSGYAQFAPMIDVFLKEHLFGDIFVRDTLNYKDRELVTISALAAMSGTDAQLNGHLRVSLNVGLTRDQLQGFVDVLHNTVSEQSAQRAQILLNSIQ
ncbi:carboxymuconolactone decarboxylase family protein [Gilvimarinus sp. SDUM040013]|uniref:Carboxymuconolactone decarboxylase family protein n=1 Tax=Gilvimarinus gilvus TaxID=3058038 RepID=A0ABU4S281_9GAMM|nr:carboxymuconolactone decarboxylase family protein [Gilvimarinus sp. SDUM040013]MDO3385629.1 carboxymuconolactone decarboxylase family protein [Gilvimarinus sp. SDUM040013]MDX6849963.1 carboxymuconolactone decarboxylase family protein [Gilvimarinus sp. SDUM040013]